MIASLLFALCLMSPAEARPAGWLRPSARSVDLPGATELPLVRGAASGYLPAVAGVAHAAKADAGRPLLVRLSLGHGLTRIDGETLSTLGGEATWSRLGGTWQRVATLDRLVLGEVVLEKVRLQVTDDVDGMVLGLAALPQLAVALKPSTGTVTLAPARDADAVLASVGTAQPLEVAPYEVYPDGATLLLPATVVLDAPRPGKVVLATDRPDSRVAPNPNPLRRAGGFAYRVGATLGGAEVVEVWAPALDELAARGVTAELGYDALYRTDLVIAVAAGRFAARATDTVQAADASEQALAFARERFAQDEAARPTDERVEGRVQIAFDSPTEATVPLGDPGDPVLRDRHLDLAEALWQANALDEALKHYLSASEFAGDHCLTHLRLGEARLAWSGTRQAQSFVQDLTAQPLEHAGTLWDQWVALTPAEREAIWRGQELPEGSLQVYQPPDCTRAWGQLVASRDAQGAGDDARAIEARTLGASLSVAVARARHLLDAGQPAEAEGALAVLRDHPELHALAYRLLQARSLAERGQRDAALELLAEVPGQPTANPLSAALAALEVGRTLGDAPAATKAMVKADGFDPTWALVHALATGEAPPPWDEAFAQQWPGSPQVQALRAVHQAASGDLDAARATLAAPKRRAVADWWAAKAVVAWLAGDDEARLDALAEWRYRFPLLPGATLGTLPPG